MGIYVYPPPVDYVLAYEMKFGKIGLNKKKNSHRFKTLNNAL